MIRPIPIRAGLSLFKLDELLRYDYDEPLYNAKDDDDVNRISPPTPPKPTSLLTMSLQREEAKAMRTAECYGWTEANPYNVEANHNQGMQLQRETHIFKEVENIVTSMKREEQFNVPHPHHTVRHVPRNCQSEIIYNSRRSVF